MIINGTAVSIIIPALNESKHLPKTLGLIKQLLGSCDGVIVADNGSTDNTVQIALEFGAQATIHAGVTIAELRNQGTKLSSAALLVFIDADVHLDHSWPTHFAETITTLTANPMTISGSRCRAADTNNFVNRYWYGRLNTETNHNYINSGHLIVTKYLFDKIKGFNATLQTGEDYDFCQRAVQAGAVIVPNSSLIAWHKGYPSTIKGFMQREMWHGRNEYTTWALFSASKVAIISISHLIFFLFALITMLSYSTIWPLIGYTFCTILLCSALTVKKFSVKPLQLFLGSTLLYYCYLVARGFAWRFRAFRPAART
ncbi:glycosyltransferase [Alishewanella sp. HL-SH06]|uniref:glycosyltransferase n=1 Tax=Alishewanella sp. HL-SH06 TaxID=3461144 RepID=UPI0040414711